MVFCTVKIFLKQPDATLIYTGLKLRKVFFWDSRYEKELMKFKFDSDDIPTLNKILKLHNLTIVVRPVFQEDSKYYPGIFFFFLHEL